MRDELAIFFENPATDPLGKEIVEGKVLCSEKLVTIRYKIKDRAFKKSEPNTIELTYDLIESVEYTSKMFGPKILTINTRNTQKLEQIPGAEVAKIKLHILKDSRDAAGQMAGFIEYNQSEAYLREQDARMQQSKTEMDL